MLYKNGNIFGVNNAVTPSSVGGIFNINAVHQFIQSENYPSFDRAGTVDSDHVHAISSLNSFFLVPNIHYILQGTNDDTSNYSVKDFNFTTGASASHTIYIGNKVNSNTSTFHNDLCVGAIQLFEGNSLILARGSSNLTDLQTMTDLNNSNTDPTGLTYASLVTGSTQERWNRAIGTGSNNTGASAGIATSFEDGGANLPKAGELNVAQAANHYIYTEVSGMINDEIVWLKLGPISLTTSAAHTLSIAYHLGVQTTDTGDDEDDELGIFIEN
tara:strand:- start:45 stop:860 length:816 start_codon:yes stop_codon:yes gene_type:complete